MRWSRTILLMGLTIGICPATEPARDMELRELWRLGSDDGASWEVLGGSLAVAANDKLVMLLDRDNFRVLVFDREGAFQRAFGQEGQGPGEFQAPSDLCFTPNGEIAVFDSARRNMTLFTMAGDYLRDQLYPQGIVSSFQTGFSDSGQLMMTTVRMTPSFQQSFSLDVYDSDLKPLRQVMQVSLPPTDWSRMSEPGFFSDYLVDQFEALGQGIPLAAPVGDGFVAIGSHDYRGVWLAADGEDAGAFAAEFKPLPMREALRNAMCRAIAEEVRSSAPFGDQLTDLVVSRAIARADLPPYASPVTALVPWGDGFATLVNYDPVTRRGGLEVFDAHGRLTATAPFAGTAGDLAFADGQLFDVGLNENETGQLVCWQVAK